MKNILSKYKSCELFLIVLIACVSIDIFFCCQSFFLQNSLICVSFLTKELVIVYLCLIIVDVTTNVIFYLKDFICSHYRKY